MLEVDLHRNVTISELIAWIVIGAIAAKGNGHQQASAIIFPLFLSSSINVLAVAMETLKQT
jgi:hypothetical protein